MWACDGLPTAHAYARQVCTTGAGNMVSHPTDLCWAMIRQFASDDDVIEGRVALAHNGLWSTTGRPGHATKDTLSKEPAHCKHSAISAAVCATTRRRKEWSENDLVTQPGIQSCLAAKTL